jgi:hypothetical protein
MPLSRNVRSSLACTATSSIPVCHTSCSAQCCSRTSSTNSQRRHTCMVWWWQHDKNTYGDRGKAVAIWSHAPTKSGKPCGTEALKAWARLGRPCCCAFDSQMRCCRPAVRDTFSCSPASFVDQVAGSCCSFAGLSLGQHDSAGPCNKNLSFSVWRYLRPAKILPWPQKQSCWVP